MKKYINLVTPDLGDSDKIELVKWYAQIGDSVKVGQELVELVTDKAAFPVEAPYNGILKEIIVPSGSIVNKGQILGILETELE
jgi:pyruvate/2-oxoglutarate dehydrogenase complex dihydrolipoamide acyltransferase (E2) component